MRGADALVTGGWVSDELVLVDVGPVRTGPFWRRSEPAPSIAGQSSLK